MKQATQLEFQWLEPAEAAPSAIDNMEMAVVRKTKALMPSIKLFAQATLTVAFAFALVFMAAIIGG